MRPFFDRTRPGRVVRAGAAESELPVLYFRDSSFGALFTADLEALRVAMPSDKLHPVPLLQRGRGCVYVAAFNYLETSIGPYGEVGVAVPAVYGDRPPPPLLPSLLESRWPGFGAVILHLPVTERVARDGGRDLWGYAKFIADMQFENTPELEACELAEGGKHILTLRVAKRGLVMRDRRPLVTYSVKNGSLIRTTVSQTAVVSMALGARGSQLELGDSHPVAQSIRALGVDPRPVMTRYYLERSAILPAGEIIETGVGPLDGYRGSDIEHGELSAGHLPSVTIH